MKKLFISLIFLLMFGLASEVWCAPLNSDQALKGITRARVIFDINVGEPKLLLTRMKLIDTTFQQLKAAGVSTEIVLAFRGRASLYITRADKYLGLDQKDNQTRMSSWIEHFSQSGFRIEQCAIAASMLDINPADFLPEVQVVENGYISLLGYQQQGYAFIPMD